MKDFELEQMELDLKELEKEILEKKYELIFDKTGLQPSEIKISNFWKCDKSPVGHCVYDKIEDPACDCCVFCGAPDERK